MRLRAKVQLILKNMHLGLQFCEGDKEEWYLFYVWLSSLPWFYLDSTFRIGPYGCERSSRSSTPSPSCGTPYSVVCCCSDPSLLWWPIVRSQPCLPQTVSCGEIDRSSNRYFRSSTRRYPCRRWGSKGNDLQRYAVRTNGLLALALVPKASKETLACCGNLYRCKRRHRTASSVDRTRYGWLEGCCV